MQALISVRSVAEARLAAAAGVRLIDCKEPRDGALGALPRPELRRIVGALRGRRIEVSATIGDAPADVAGAVRETFDCGVDVVKVGIVARAQLDALRRLPGRVVPVLLADRGFDDALFDAACDGFDTLMLDTADKAAGTLFDVLPSPALRRCIDRARRCGRRIGLAGALRIADVPRVRELSPDFAGFRSAVCEHGRGGTLGAAPLHALLDALRDRPG